MLAPVKSGMRVLSDLRPLSFTSVDVNGALIFLAEIFIFLIELFDLLFISSIANINPFK